MFCHLSIIHIVDSVSSTSGRVGSDVHTVTQTLRVTTLLLRFLNIGELQWNLDLTNLF